MFVLCNLKPAQAPQVALTNSVLTIFSFYTSNSCWCISSASGPVRAGKWTQGKTQGESQPLRNYSSLVTREAIGPEAAFSQPQGVGVMLGCSKWPRTRGESPVRLSMAADRRPVGSPNGVLLGSWEPPEIACHRRESSGLLYCIWVEPSRH